MAFGTAEGPRLWWLLRISFHKEIDTNRPRFDIVQLIYINMRRPPYTPVTSILEAHSQEGGALLVQSAAAVGMALSRAGHTFLSRTVQDLPSPEHTFSHTVSTNRSH